jgi:hypothetical protein
MLYFTSFYFKILSHTLDKSLRMFLQKLNRHEKNKCFKIMSLKILTENVLREFAKIFGGVF